MSFSTIILAAGKGTRMKSSLPKVLHAVCGRPMIDYPLIEAKKAGTKEIIVVIGHGAEAVKASLKEEGQLSFIIQEEQLGTGHAVKITENAIKDKDLPIVILCGDAPLIRSSTISRLVSSHIENRNVVTVLTADMDRPAGYGRIIKDGSEIRKIVEEKDATYEEKCISEVNSGVYCVDGRFLFEALKKVGSNNAQGEYYLTDIIAICGDSKLKVSSSRLVDSGEILGINSRKDLAEANRLMRERITDRLMEGGVSILDPDNTYIDSGVEIGSDAIIYPQARLEGSTFIGNGCIIETGTQIKDSKIGDDSHIKPYCVISESVLEGQTTVGPFAHIRPHSHIKRKAKVGNFVEIKKSVIDEGSKVNHLSYIGDSEIGRDVNIGAGTITCNYDGYNKFKTTIEDGAFIGSGSNLVAPVTVGKGAIIGAGSTITKTVAQDSLALTRADQRAVKDWAKKKREKAMEKD
ncbi:MAG: bifunctional UDP-N-acetylglucosamine diphosphorylase/glucosamine-1-phosphate N-acetyltransferase GlmU [bacterium]|nr:bifunctional UDP-N-acetylglucosamine diphosphorylase/glucosamine-1-phosphate N-acetyltransferase GlmU [bacterium]